jgi:hypothetical protein
MWMLNGRQALQRALTSLRTFSAQPTADAFESAVHDRGGGALSRAQDFVPRIANLSSTRAVLRLAGPDLLTFLQVWHWLSSMLELQSCILDSSGCNDVAAERAGPSYKRCCSTRGPACAAHVRMHPQCARALPARPVHAQTARQVHA